MLGCIAKGDLNRLISLLNKSPALVNSKSEVSEVGRVMTTFCVALCNRHIYIYTVSACMHMGYIVCVSIYSYIYVCVCVYALMCGGICFTWENLQFF